MKAKRIIVIPLIMALIVLCMIKHYTITSDAHTHEYNSIYSVESTSFIREELWCEYEEDGHLYQVWYGHYRSHMYQTCYCGHRGNYKDEDSPDKLCRTFRVW